MVAGLAKAGPRVARKARRQRQTPRRTNGQPAMAAKVMAARRAAEVAKVMAAKVMATRKAAKVKHPAVHAARRACSSGNAKSLW